MLFYFIQELFSAYLMRSSAMLSSTASTAGKNSTTSKSTIRSTSLSRTPLYLCTIVGRQILYLRQQEKVNTLNTAKVRQALKVTAVIYLHLSLITI